MNDGIDWVWSTINSVYSSAADAAFLPFYCTTVVSFLKIVKNSVLSEVGLIEVEKNTAIFLYYFVSSSNYNDIKLLLLKLIKKFSISNIHVWNHINDENNNWYFFLFQGSILLNFCVITRLYITIILSIIGLFLFAWWCYIF